MDIVDELDGSQEPNGEAVVTEAAPAVEAPVAEAPAETPAEAAARERDEKGRFKAKEQDQPMVPLAALHDTRDKVRDLEARLAAMQQPQPQGQQIPDIFEDPEGFVRYQNTQLQAVTLNTTLNISEEMTRASAGNETVEAAQQWGAQAFPANPALYQQFISQRNPYGFLVEQYRRATAFQQLGDDPAKIEEFVKWREAQSAPQAQRQQQVIPTSLASAQSARGTATTYQPPSLDDLLKG